MEPIPFTRRHHPHVPNYVQYLPPYDKVPLLRCHVHPYPAIVNAMTKFHDFPLHELPDRYQESIGLAQKIWDCWMTERVLGPPLNTGHRRAAHGAPLSTASTPSPAPFSWSSPPTLEPSSSLYSRNRQKYCSDDLFGRCYNRPKRDPPVPVSQMYLPHRRILTEPETVLTTMSSSRSCLGTPPAGESLWWPDEHITPSCVESVSSGIVYEREDEQVVLRYDDMASSFDGSTYSHAPLDDPAYQPPQQLNKTIPPTRKADNRSRPALYTV